MHRPKALLLLCSILLSLSCTGCLSPIQLNRQAIVQSIGIDYADDRYRLTFQIYSPASEAGSGISASADNAKLITADGKTVSEALQKGTRMQGKELFLGQNRILVIGFGAAKHSLAEAISYLGTTGNSRQNAHVLISSTTAESILSQKLNQGILPAEALEHLTENAFANGLARTVRLFELRKTLSIRHESAALPVISVKEEGEPTAAKPEQSGQNGDSEPKIESVSALEIGGTAIFSDDVFRGFLDAAQTRGMLWIRGEVENTAVAVDLPLDVTASVRIHHAESKLIPINTGEKLAFSLSIICDATKEDSFAAEAAYHKDEQKLLHDMSRAAEAVIREECRSVFEGAARNQLCDFLNLGNILWQRDPALFSRLREEWNSHMSEIELTTDVKVRINRVGIEYGAGE